MPGLGVPPRPPALAQTPSSSSTFETVVHAGFYAALALMLALVPLPGSRRKKG
jgi:hypothetical protein